MYGLFKLILCEESEKYDYNIENQHDKLFKDLLNDKQEVRDFLQDYLKINLNKKQIEKCNNIYISSKYKRLESDIVYKVKNENVYILIEHQSTVDERMPYRILNYATEILREDIDINHARKKEYEYPLIIPIVLYTGERKWKVPQNYSEKIKKDNYGEKYMEMKYEIIDINKYSEEELLAKKTALSYAMIIEKNKGKESLIKILEKISDNCTNEEIGKKMEKIIKYLLYPILKEDTEDVLKKFYKKEVFNMKTAQDYIKDEIAEIRRKGMERGIEEGKKIIIMNMARNKLGIKQIKEYTGISEDEIQKIVSNM